MPLDLVPFIGEYSPIPYLDSNGVQMFALDIPYICRFLVLLVVIFYFVKGIFTLCNAIAK